MVSIHRASLQKAKLEIYGTEFTKGRVIAFSNGRDRRNGDDLIAPIKRSALLLEISDDRWLASRSGIIPIGNLIARYRVRPERVLVWRKRLVANSRSVAQPANNMPKISGWFVENT
jgi:hypothetical protein